MPSEYRLDFTFEVVSCDDTTKTVQFIIKPDPKRYEEKVIDGKEYLYDKYDNFLIEREMLNREMIKQLQGMPLNLQTQEIGNIDDYLRSRFQEAESFLLGSSAHPYEYIDKSEEFLSAHAESTLAFAILSVDIASSTKLALSVDHQKYVAVVKSYINELSLLIPQFHGYILKFTGDGLLAYFPAPSLIRMNDLALDCALSIRRVVYDCLNPIFGKHHLPSIEIRIGMDSGEASIVELGDISSRSQKDIIGSVINVATKVQGAGNPSNVTIGHSAVKLLHRMYREAVEEVETSPEWPYKDKEGGRYKVFKVKDNAPITL